MLHVFYYNRTIEKCSHFRIGHFSREAWFLLLANRRKQGLGAGGAPQLLGWSCLSHVYWYTSTCVHQLRYVHKSIDRSACLHLYLHKGDPKCTLMPRDNPARGGHVSFWPSPLSVTLCPLPTTHRILTSYVSVCLIVWYFLRSGYKLLLGLEGGTYYNLSPQEAEAGRQWIGGLPELCSQTLSQKKKRSIDVQSLSLPGGLFILSVPVPNIHPYKTTYCFINVYYAFFLFCLFWMRWVLSPLLLPRPRDL